MKTHPYSDSIPSIPGACQVSQTGSLADLAETPRTGKPGTLIRAERTPGAVAASGLYGESRGELYSLPGTPKTNSKPFARSEGFPVIGAVGWLLPRVEPSTEERPGPEKE